MCISTPSVMKTHHEIFSLPQCTFLYKISHPILFSTKHCHHSLSHRLAQCECTFDVLVFPELCFLVRSVFLYILPYNNTMKHIFILLPMKYIKKQTLQSEAIKQVHLTCKWRDQKFARYSFLGRNLASLLIR